MNRTTQTSWRILVAGILLALGGGMGSLRAQTLAAALDTTNVVWTTGGDVPWLVQSTNTHDGVDAARSGKLGANQSSWIEAAVVGPATIRFWKGSMNGPSRAARTFSINGQWLFGELIFPNGSLIWDEHVYDLAAGTNVLRWTISDYSGYGTNDYDVLDEFRVEPPRPLAITYQPQSVATYPGLYDNFSVGVEGTPPFYYQWRKDGINIPQTNSSFFLDFITTNDVGVYSVVISNSQGFVISSNAALTILPPVAPAFGYYEPASVTGYVGQVLSVYASVQGSPPMTFQWRRDGTNAGPPILDWGFYGGFAPNFLFTNAALADAGTYSLLVTNEAGSLQSSNFVVTVLPSVAPAFTIQPRSVEVAAGVRTWFKAAATGGPTPDYTWTKVGVPPLPPPSPPFPIGSSLDPTRLLFTNASPNDAGVYFVTAQNLAGELKSHEALLTVLPPIIGIGGWWQGAVDIFVTNGLAYLAQGSAGFSILSVSNPAAPILLGGYNTPGYASGVHVADGRAYVADQSGGMEIFNVTNPFNPTFLGSYHMPYYATKVVVRSNLAYVIDGNSGLAIVNVSNPALPSLVGNYTNNISPWDIALAGNLAYLAADEGLIVMDVSNPAQPVETGRVTGSYSTVSASGPLAFAIGQGASVIDASNPTQPYVVGSLWMSTTSFPSFPPAFYDLQAANGLVYLIKKAGTNMSLYVVDVRDPQSPIPVGEYSGLGLDYCIFVEGNRVYVSGAESSVKIIQTPFVTGPELPLSLSLTAQPELRLGIHGRRGRNYEVEAAGAPAGAAWQTLKTVLLTNDTGTVTLSPTGAAQFFRAKQVD